MAPRWEGGKKETNSRKRGREVDEWKEERERERGDK